MADEKALALLAEVLEKTRTDRLGWQAASGDRVFVAALAGKYSLLLRESIDFTLKSSVDLVLRDAKGNEVVAIGSSESEVARKDLVDLFTLARKQTLDVDEKMDEALQVLKAL